MEFINEKPLEYHASHGTIFKSTRSDLRTGVTIIKSPHESFLSSYTSDMVEFGWYHATEILSKLNGSPGYDSIEWTVEESREGKKPFRFCAELPDRKLEETIWLPEDVAPDEIPYEFSLWMSTNNFKSKIGEKIKTSHEPVDS